MAEKMVCAVLLGAVALTGCTTGPKPDSTHAVSQADSMWLSRTTHLGDNSKVIALTAAAGFGSMGA